jgi:maleate isomerase
VEKPLYRIGLIVPSSNTTMETELPALFSRREESFTFHAARVRMSKVTPEELDAMVQATDTAAQALGDAAVDAIAYACLVAVMCQGLGAHRKVESHLSQALSAAEVPPIVSSAGALISGLRAVGARRLSIIAPYRRQLTEQVVRYIEAEGFEVIEAASLEVDDNRQVGWIDPQRLTEEASRIETDAIDALVLSACVQMPSLPIVQQVEDTLGVPVVTAATATARELLLALGLDPVIPGAGSALAPAMARSRSV